MRLRNLDPAVQAILFNNPLESLTIAGPGAAAITILSLDPDFVDLSGTPITPQIVAGSAPTNLNLSANNVAENSSVGSLVGTLSSIDPDGGGVTYTLIEGTGGEHNSSFTLDANGQLRTASAFDFETNSAYNILVRAADSAGLSLDRAFKIAVANVNEVASSISLSQSVLNENKPAGSVIGSLANNDPDLNDSANYVLVSVSPNDDSTKFTIEGSTLKSTAAFDYEAKGSYSIRVRSTDSGGASVETQLEILVGNIIEDVTKPLSSVQTIPAQASSLTIPLTIAATDPTGPEVEVTGIREYELYAAIDSGTYALVTTLPASTTTYNYLATSNHNYYFRTLARDLAGNLEINTGGADAYTWVRDFDKPDTSVTAANFNASGLFTINVSGRDSGGSSLTRFDVYAVVDTLAPTLIGSINAGTPNGSGLHSGSLNYQGLTDGALHSYRFYSRGLDAVTNLEDAPSSGDVLQSASFAVPASLQASGIDVQSGAKQRSFVQFVDVLFNSATNLSELLVAGRVQVEKFGLTATSVVPGTGQAVSATLTQPGSGNRLRLDFGAQGLGGNRNALTGDGFYRVRVDSNRDGDFDDAGEAFEFHRLLGDANGDGVINDLDTAVVDSFYGRLGSNLDGDLNGDGVVNLTDKSYTLRTYRNRSLSAPLRLLLDD